MELNLSHLLEKKEVDIRLGDNVFTGVISASVIDIVQNQSTKQIKKLLKSKKVNLGALNDRYKNQNIETMENADLFKLFESLNIDLSDLIDANNETHNEIVSAFFGEKTYQMYARTVDQAEIHVINKEIYNMIVNQIKMDTKKQKKNEKNE